MISVEEKRARYLMGDSHLGAEGRVDHRAVGSVCVEEEWLRSVFLQTLLIDHGHRHERSISGLAEDTLGFVFSPIVVVHRLLLFRSISTGQSQVAQQRKKRNVPEEREREW